jgi:hypothetical protein
MPDELRQDAARGLGMQERNLEPEEAVPRALVDQVGSAGGEAAQLLADIVDLEGYMVHARPPLGEELADRCLGPEGREQLDSSAADPHRCGLDALIDDQLTVLELGAEQAAVRVDSLVEVGDGDP